MIMQSLKSGALSLPPVYDDSSYFSDAARRLVLFYRFGLHELVSYTVAAPPHGPLSTALAFSGFALFGIEPWAAVAANSILLFFFVRLFYWMAAPLPLRETTLLAIAFLAAPFFSMTVLECRPDMYCSLFIAVGTLGMVVRDWLGQRRVQVIAGLAFGAALWAKPTVFPLTIALFIAAMFFAALPALRRREWRGVIRAGAVTMGVGLLLAAPYYVLAWRHVVDYIWTTAFGSEAAIWVQPLPFLAGVLYYLTGPTGAESLGPWLWLGVGIGIAALLILLSRRHRSMAMTAAQVVAIVVIAYLAVTIPSFKGPHGLPFAAVFLCAAALAAVFVATALPRIARLVFCVLLAGLSISQFHWRAPQPYGNPDPLYGASRWEMVHEAFQAMDHNAVGKTILLTTSAVFVNPTILEIEYFRRGLMPPRNIEIQRSGDLREHESYIRRADMVFAVSPDFKEIFPNLPTASPEFRASEIRLIEASGLFYPPVRIADPIGGGEVLIYRRPEDVLQDFSSVENLRNPEGPYPKWELPRVRWGTGSETRIHASGRPGSRAELVVRARTVPVANQTLSVLVNGEERMAASKLSYEFQGYIVPFAYDDKGRADIELRYGTPASESALYRSLWIRQ
ncbi:hypothetical protein CAL12_26930 [Bordetella genomosp. 8]|uniref:Glycosyltransferase RgtA/B/C/D-like domain-containing protein n=1 Tax=Bordetella genomosp. 8 TaxID=1416806 RepID=A0A1W6YSV4_9BORD|nr:hypothetical protein CAL12_26930 [Bordetella genomosp. 8]